MRNIWVGTKPDQGRLLAQFDKMVDIYGFEVVDASGSKAKGEFETLLKRKQQDVPGASKSWSMARR